MDGLEASTHVVPKTLFLDIVKVLTANGIAATQIPAKLESLALGAEVTNSGKTWHTLWVANDNDSVQINEIKAHFSRPIFSARFLYQSIIASPFTPDYLLQVTWTVRRSQE
jgi:hypothetical protein